MRIIFVNRFFFPDHSATSQILSDLAFALADDGEDIHVVTSRLSYDDASKVFLPYERVRGVTVHRVWTARFGRRSFLGRLADYLTFYPSAFVTLLRNLRSGDAVVAKTDPPLISIPAWVAAWLRGAVLVNWLQDMFPEVAAALGVRAARGTLGQLLAWMRDQTLRVAAMNVVLSRSMAAVVQRCGVSTERIAIVPNWADGNLIRPMAPDRNPLRLEWNLSGKLVVGYSGNLGRAHEFGTILGAAEKLRDDPGIVFVFIGQGYGHSSLQAEVTRRGLRNVVFKPYQPRSQLGISLTLPDVHVVSLLPALEGYVLPSKFYGIAAAGRPVIFIGSSEGDLAEEIDRFQCGFVVQPTHCEDLVATLRKLQYDRALREDMGRHIRFAFDENFEMKHSLFSWRALFRRLKDERFKTT